MDKLSVEIINNVPTSKQAIEIVERKGVGHPDYICDAVMDEISVALSKEYIRAFGDVLHHNIDKGLLSAGETVKRFGGGRVISPMEFVIGDRATFRVGRKKIPVEDIARKTVKDWFKRNLKQVDVERDLRIRVALKPGSIELSDIFKDRKRIRGANDTSAAVGYAPFTKTEKAVYECERFLNGTSFKTSFPETGEDVKVMGLRRGRSLDLTIAMPLFSRYIRSEKDYFSRKKDVKAALREFIKREGDFSFKDVTINYNTLDSRGRGVNGLYLTLLGTSAEDADSGQVGRGNRVNGVISLNRPMGTEAAAGKNPVSHVGKIYTILAHSMAEAIYAEVDGIEEVCVWLLSEIGSPVNKPKAAAIQIIPAKPLRYAIIKQKAEAIVNGFLSDIGSFTDELITGKYPVC